MKTRTRDDGSAERISIETISTFRETGGQPNPFAVHFLRMAIGLWADGFPDDEIQGIGKADAMTLAGEITGKVYGPEDFAAALADLDACRERLRAARQRIGG